MKRILLFICASLLLTACDMGMFRDELNELHNEVDELKVRLDELCEEVNTNMESLTAILEAIQKNDFVKSIVPIKEGDVEIGYVITFSQSGSVTIYHGQRGEDGHTPAIGVLQGEDGVWYWTIDGVWLTDSDGNKVRATGLTGASGVDGEDGVDGVTPQLKIENGYWYVSLDNGASWTYVGKATGEKGDKGDTGVQGDKGTDGEDGHAPVISVRQGADGVWYWVIDGEWLLDANGNKVVAAGRDGKDGQDGENGQDGAPGKDGTDGVTPQLKIEGGYWYVTYDGGTTWVKLGQATGDKGEQGVSGDNFFRSVTQDQFNVYLTLADGTIIIIPREVKVEDVEITFLPEYSDGKATLFYIVDEGCYAEMEFEVLPKDAAARIAGELRDCASVSAILTQTRATDDMIDMPIISITSEEAGFIIVKASGENLPTEVISGTQDVRVRFAVSSEKINLLSDYIQLVPEEIIVQKKNEIWYTTTTESILEPYKSKGYGAEIISNTYEDGKGVIVFDGPVTEIPEMAFYNKSALKSIHLPKETVAVGKDAFYYCRSLAEVTLPDKLESLHERAFGYAALTTVTMPESLIEVEEKAFYGCQNITAFYGKYSSDDNKCLIVDGMLVEFANGCELSEYEIPEGVVRIGKGAFLKTKVAKVIIPETVETIGTDAFWGSTVLTDITIPDSVKELGGYSFSSCSNLTNVKLGKGITKIEDETFNSCTSLSGIEIPDGVTTIGKRAFYACAAMRYIKIPASLTHIYGYAFEPYSTSGGYYSRSIYITDLAAWCNIEFSDSGSSVHGSDFYINGEKVTDIVIPDGVTEIKKYTFSNNLTLTSLVIPASVTAIGKGAFEQCNKLFEIHCLSPEPPAGNTTMFSPKKEERKIYVPAGSGDAYRAAAGWSNYADSIIEE